MSANIKVVVRLRPVDDGKKEKWAPGLEIHGRRIQLGMKVFEPDITLKTSTTQEEMYDFCRPIVETVQNRANGTIMVYGQTGTGKTFSMFGTPEEPSGIAYQAIDSLLEYTRSCVNEGRKMALSLAVLEIYNEKITDMLGGNAEVTLVAGFPRSCTKRQLTSSESAVNLVQQTLRSRHVTATAMNERSSRSHVILMLDVEESLEDGSVEVAHLFLVDLAGSESVKKSQAQGKAASEAGMINKSLLALKNVIVALSTNNNDISGGRSHPHVPYRDSKLTEMLQDSIGGTARTMLIACVSPNARDIEETKSTLEYATKARNIKNVAGTDRDKLVNKVRTLEMELTKAKNRIQDRLNEKNGIFIPKEEYESLMGLPDIISQRDDDIKKLLADRTAYEVAKHVVESQVAGLSESLEKIQKDYDAAVEEHENYKRTVREQIESALAAFETQAKQERTLQAKGVLDWQEGTYSEWSAYSQRYSDLCKAIDKTLRRNAQEVKQSHHQMTEATKALTQTMTNSVINNVTAIIENTNRQLAELGNLVRQHGIDVTLRLDATHEAMQSSLEAMVPPISAEPFIDRGTEFLNATFDKQPVPSAELPEEVKKTIELVKIAGQADRPSSSRPTVPPPSLSRDESKGSVGPRVTDARMTFGQQKENLPPSELGKKRSRNTVGSNGDDDRPRSRPTFFNKA